MERASTPLARIQSSTDFSTVKSFRAGTVILAQGARLPWTGRILSGRARALSVTRDGTEIWVCDFGPGDWIGASHVLGADPSIVQIVATEAMSLSVFRPENFSTALGCSAELRQAYLTFAATRLHQMTARVVQARSLSAKGRICECFVELSRPIGIRAGHHVIRPVPVFSKVALRAGSTRETVSRLVSSLVRRGVLQRMPGALLIPDLARLQDEIS